MKKYEGEEFLNRIYKDLHTSEIVMHTALNSDNKNEKIEKYLSRLEKITKKAYNSSRENDIELLKSLYYDKYVIKPEHILESYFENQKRIAIESGRGNIWYTEKQKKDRVSKIIQDQKESLDKWIEYLGSDDTNKYPTWFKYYVFQGMLKLGIFDKSKNEYTKRTKYTAHPFIEINREALAMVYDELVRFFNKEEVTDEKLRELVENGNFGKVYGYAIRKLDSVLKNNIKSDDGIWKKYKKNSNAKILFDDIHGKGTGWCTAGGLETAKEHIRGGDFYVYYTIDSEGNYTIPRIAIRKEDNKIAEIRGIDEHQNLESNMERILEKKLEEHEFSDREEYKKKVNDMEMLSYIYTKYKNNIELTIDDFKFIYEVDKQILGFGYGKDPRIKEILDSRNIKKDLSNIIGCLEEEIALTEEEALSGNIIYYNKDLNLRKLETAQGLKLPEKLGGSLYLSGLISAKDLVLPKEIRDNLYLGNLTSAEGLELPEKLGGSLHLPGLLSVVGLVLPKVLGGSLYLNSIKSAQGLKLPYKLNGDLNLSGLISIEGLELPKEINGVLNLNNLTTAQGLILPEKLGKSLHLSNLVSAEGVIFPKEVGGSLSLGNLTSVVGLELPEKIVGSLYLNSLTNVENLKLPKELGGLNLENLVSADGLELPEKIKGNLNLNSLISAKGLKLPKEVAGNLYLSSLTSAEGLVLPEKIGGNLYLIGLTSIENLKLPKEIGGQIFIDESLINQKNEEISENINKFNI